MGAMPTRSAGQRREQMSHYTVSRRLTPCVSQAPTKGKRNKRKTLYGMSLLRAAGAVHLAARNSQTPRIRSGCLLCCSYKVFPGPGPLRAPAPPAVPGALCVHPRLPTPGDDARLPRITHSGDTDGGDAIMRPHPTPTVLWGLEI